MPHNMEIVT